jgi:hypothetical protein
MLQKKILILFNENNLNNFCLDYLYDNIKKKLVNVLKKNFIITIICYTNYQEKYEYKFMNRELSHKLLCDKLDMLNVIYVIKAKKKIEKLIINNNNLCINNNNLIINIDNIIYDLKDNNNSNKNYDYIFYIPPNSYVHNNIDINLINNNNILIDKISNAFILPFKYIDIIKSLFLNKYDEIKNIKYIKICYYHKININFNIDTNKIDNNQVDNIKKIIGLNHININNISCINKLVDLKLNIPNINNLYIKYNTNGNNNVALAIIGQIRTFLKKEIYESIKTYVINDFERNNINYMLFFYVENKMEYYWQDINKEKYTYNISKKKIEDGVKNITDKYILKFYNVEDIKKEMEIITDFSYNLQLFLLYKTYLDIIEYEKNNNIYFKYLIKVRPDIKYNKYISNLLNMRNLNNKFIFHWDIIYIFPRHLLSLIENIYYLSIFPRLEDLFNNYFNKYYHKFIDKTKYIFKDITKIDSHKYAHICMWLNNIETENVSICEVIRP